MAKKNKSHANAMAAPVHTPPSASSSVPTAEFNSGVPLATADSAPGYFSKFATFTPKADATFIQQFDALAINQGWSKREKAKKRSEAIREEFDALYGTDTTKLEKWQELCREVGVEEVPASINKCKKALGSRKVMVNLVNLIDHRRCGTPLMTFANYSAFVAYTRKHTFSRKEAKKDGFIRALLRRIF